MSVPYDEAANQAAQQVVQAPPESVVDELAHTDRPAPLPAEADMDAMMAEFKAMTERLKALEADAAHSKQQYAAAVAALGPPAVAVYAKGIADKLVSFRNAHPDLPGHFDRLIEQATPLGAAAQAVIDGDTGKTADVTGLLPDVAAAVDRFITRTHSRLVNKPLDFSALAADVEYALEAADKLKAA